MKKALLQLVGALLASTALTSQAAVIVSLVGDKDCFGIGSAACVGDPVPADGTRWRDDLGGVFFTDYRDAGDLATAPFTDRWAANGGFSYTHSYSLTGTALSANLAIQIAGIHDINHGDVYSVSVDGTPVGVIPPNTSAIAFQEVLLYNFSIPAILLNGSDGVTVTVTVGDGFSVNFSELTITTVPEPFSPALLGVALAALALVRRRRAGR